jgi:hypothetical protein
MILVSEDLVPRDLVRKDLVVLDPDVVSHDQDLDVLHDLFPFVCFFFL